MTARLILAGGGLANGLIALKLREARPDVEVTILEGGSVLGGNHTWSFHAEDLTADQHDFVAPLVVHRWPGQEVAFPDYQRRFAAGYCSVTSERFAEVLGERLRGRVRLNARIEEVKPDCVRLAGGEELRADAVIDGRGFRASPHMVIRFQSFVGREIRFAAAHGQTVPVIMDATTPQDRGYRFTYVLPFAPDTALIEDTGYLDSGALDEAEMDARIDSYCRGKGWRAAETLRRETGVLPITLSGDIEAYWAEAKGVPSVGLAGNFFHPTTGYSLPDAVRVAEMVAGLPDFGHRAVFESLRGASTRAFAERGFHRGLNRMLFLAGPPEKRWRVMQRFYSLKENLIARFYADRLTSADKLRILTGKPPVSMIRAVAALLSDGRVKEAV